MSAAKKTPATTPSPNPLALSIALTEHTRALCQGLEDGSAEILNRVTPYTADLLKWQMENKTHGNGERRRPLSHPELVQSGPNGKEYGMRGVDDLTPEELEDLGFDPLA